MSQSRPPRRSPRKITEHADPGAATRTSVVRCVLALVLVAVGIAWIVVYVTVAAPTNAKPGLPQMGELGRWNYTIGFVTLFVGLALAAHPSTPMGRGRGVVIGMLGCFLIGLIWIVVYYVTGQDITLPLLTDLGQYNLVVGIGFMAVGFVYATHWE